MSETAKQLVERAYAVRREGDASGALELYRRAKTAFAGDAAGRAHCLRHTGDLLHELDRLDEARADLEQAEALYRGPVRDTLSLANTLRLRALVDPSEALWREARQAYEQAGAETGLDLQPALDECDRRMAHR